MEVTRKNFKEALPLVEKSIKAADFLVIDTEFTGLMNGRDVSIFDSPQEYYLRLLNGCSDFMLIQFGLCAFYWNADRKHYMNDAYNFYLFPRVRPGPERMFLCQSSSLDFLSSQGFDFNKLFKEGISYMTEPIETRLRENLTERQKTYTKDCHITVPEENKQQIEDICKKVRTFIDEKKSSEMEIDRCNGFIRKLLFQELGSRFKQEVIVESKVLDNKDRVLKVTRVTSPSDVKDRDAMKKEKEWEEMEEAVGFSRVARMISQSGKTVIGHNMVLDVLHSLSHFFQPPPADYAAFKEFAHCMFPKLLDTKYMASLPPFKDKVNSSVLPHLFATLCEAPFALPRVTTKKGRGYTSADDKQHEAGYDAYVTGLCFLSMHGHLSKMRGEENGRVTTESAILKPFINKLYLAKTAHQDSPYINLVGKDPNPSRDHVFHLTFPKEWTRNDITQLFSPFGQILVQFLDDTSALVALQRREQAPAAARALQGHGRAQLVPLARHMAKMQTKDRQWRKLDDYPANILSTPEHVQKSRPAVSLVSSPYIPEKVERELKPPEVKTPEVKPPTVKPPTVKPPSVKPPIVKTPEVKPAEVKSPEVKPPEVKSPEAPKAERRRTQSATVTATALSPVAKVARKRASSGVFQVDNAEPPPKKSGSTRAPADDEPGTPPPPAPNGRRQSSGGNETQLPKKVIERFDETASNKCVAAFKESDSWD